MSSPLRVDEMLGTLYDRSIQSLGIDAYKRERGQKHATTWCHVGCPEQRGRMHEQGVKQVSVAVERVLGVWGFNEGMERGPVETAVTCTLLDVVRQRFTDVDAS